MQDPTPLPSCCGMVMCKDEAAHIRACLESLVPFCSVILVVDTGSQDDTVSIAADVALAHPDVEIRLRTTEWHGFAQTRNDVLRFAQREDTRWLFTIDADEVVEGDAAAALRTLDASTALVGAVERMVSGAVSMHAAFMRSDIAWYYEGDIHEALHHPDTQGGLLPTGASLALPGMVIQHNHAAGDQRSVKDDLEKFRAAHERDPNNPRWIFYMAQAYANLGRRAQARRWYARFITLFQESDQAQEGTVNTAAWWCALQIATLDGNEKGLKDLYAQVPIRVEPLWELVCLYRSRSEWGKAYETVMIAYEMPEPDASTVGIFHQRLLYRFVIPMEAALLSAAVGKIEQAEEIAARFLARDDIPAEVRTGFEEQVAQWRAAFANAEQGVTQ